MNIWGRGLDADWSNKSVYFFTTAGPVLTNGRAVLPALGQSVPGVLDISVLKVNFDLHTAATVIKKNALAISAVAFTLSPLIPFIPKV